MTDVTITVSPELAKFYRWYLEQVTAPELMAENNPLTHTGLCYAISLYALRNPTLIQAPIQEEQDDLLRVLYGTSIFPFCTGSEYSNDYACHTHPKRLAHAARFADWS